MKESSGSSSKRAKTTAPRHGFGIEVEKGVFCLESCYLFTELQHFNPRVGDRHGKAVHSDRKWPRG